MLAEGNAYLAHDFPKMSKINSAWVAPYMSAAHVH